MKRETFTPARDPLIELAAEWKRVYDLREASTGDTLDRFADKMDKVARTISDTRATSLAGLRAQAMLFRYEAGESRFLPQQYDALLPNFFGALEELTQEPDCSTVEELYARHCELFAQANASEIIDDAELDREFWGKIDALEAEIMARPSKTPADFAAKLLVSHENGERSCLAPDHPIWLEARALIAEGG